MGNGCRANPCLIGKGSTAESLNQDPDDAAIHGVIIEGTEFFGDFGNAFDAAY